MGGEFNISILHSAAKGEKGVGAYKGTEFHRVVKNFVRTSEIPSDAPDSRALHAYASLAFTLEGYELKPACRCFKAEILRGEMAQGAALYMGKSLLTKTLASSIFLAPSQWQMQALIPMARR